jgi:preprotein translocase subunit SecF
MVVGIIVGTYSTLFIAVPLVAWWYGRGGGAEAAAVAAAPPARKAKTPAKVTA